MVGGTVIYAVIQTRTVRWTPEFPTDQHLSGIVPAQKLVSLLIIATIGWLVPPFIDKPMCSYSQKMINNLGQC